LLGPDDKVLVVQPRRLVVTSLAARISRERGFERLEDGDVGFRIGGVSTPNAQTARILVVTYGILLNMLEGGGGDFRFSRVILDEIHERGFEFDVGLAILCTKLKFAVMRPKLVLMSATVDISPLQQYCRDHDLTSAKVEIDRESFKVIQYHLEDLQDRFSLPRDVFTPPEDKDFGSPKLTPSRRIVLLKLLKHLHEKTPVSAGIVVFLIGISLISEFNQLIHENLSTVKPYEVIPIHSSYPLEEQQRAVKIMKGKRKASLFYFCFCLFSFLFLFSQSLLATLTFLPLPRSLSLSTSHRLS